MKKALISFGFVACVCVAFAGGLTLNASVGVIDRGELVETLEEELATELIQINERLADINRSLIVVHNDYLRTQHYIAGHNSEHPIDQCPICGIQEQLRYRDGDIAKKIETLTAAMSLVDEKSSKFEELRDRMIKLEVERRTLRKYLFNADAQAKAVSEITKEIKQAEEKGK